MLFYFLIYFLLSLLKLNTENLLICHRYFLTENNFSLYVGISDQAGQTQTGFVF